MKKSNLIFALGIFIIFIGILVLLQASDLNPLLAIDKYCIWINTHYYGENPIRGIVLIFATYLIGAIIIGIGWRIIKHDESKKSKEPILDEENMELDI